MEKIYNKLFKNSLTIALTVIISSAVIVAGVYAATTISANIETAGTFEATGNATTSANLVVGTGSKVWQVPTSTLTVDGGGYFTGDVILGTSASATDYLIVGNSAGDDDDLLYFDIGRNEYLGWDDDPGEFDLTDDLNIDGVATTTTGAVLGATAPSNGATTTITFGSYGTADTKGLCLKFHTSAITIYCYFDTTIGSTASNGAIWCSTTAACEDGS